jgi:hypothetical protein
VEHGVDGRAADGGGGVGVKTEMAAGRHGVECSRGGGELLRRLWGAQVPDDFRAPPP